jgi:hypothetical protein
MPLRPQILRRPHPRGCPHAYPDGGPGEHRQRFRHRPLGQAINAEISAYSNIDCTCAEEVFSGEALSAIETQIDDLVADGLVWEQEFVDGRVVDIRPISSSEVEVDTCEIWAGEFYGLYDGSHYHSVPPTLYLRMITMEEPGLSLRTTSMNLPILAVAYSSDKCHGG